MINWNGIHIYDKTDVNNKLRDLLNSIKRMLGGKVDSPLIPGASGQVLSSDGRGGTEWKTVQGGGGGASGSIAVTVNILKGDGEGNAVAATPNIDYITWNTYADALNRLDTLEAAKAEKFTYGSSTYSSVSTAITRQRIPYVYYNDRIYIGAYKDSQKIVFISMDDSHVYEVRLSTQGTWSNTSTGLARSTDITSLTTSLNGKEDKTNKVTSIGQQSTDTQYPSAKAVHDAIGALANGVEEGYMPKANAQEGILLESDANGCARSSGRSVADLVDVLFGYKIKPVTYVYRWQFDFDAGIYGPSIGSFSVDASIRIRTTTYNIQVTGNYGDWDMSQAFAETIAEYINSQTGLIASVESYDSNKCVVSISSQNEVSFIMSDIYVYSTINDYVAMCMVGDAHPWISSRDITQATPVTGEEGFYALNDPASDRYDDSGSKIYVDRITGGAYSFHDGGYHLVKATPEEEQYDLSNVFTNSDGATFTDAALDAYVQAASQRQAFGYVSKQVEVGSRTLDIKVPVMLTARGSWGITLYYDYTEADGGMRRILRTLMASGSGWQVADAWDKVFIS